MPIYDPALRGFGDLASALMLAPQQARQRRIEEEDKLIRQQERDQALQQALMFRQQDQAIREQDRAERNAYQQQQFGLEQQKFTAAGEQTKAQAERQKRLDAESDRERTFRMARDTADTGRQTLQFYEGKRHNQALEEATRGKAEKPEEVKPGAVRNFGSDENPDWREFDPKSKTWKPPMLADALGVAVPSKAAAAATAQAAAAPPGPLAPTWTNPATGEVLELGPEGKGYAPKGFRAERAAEQKAIYPSYLAEAKRAGEEYDMNQEANALQARQAEMKLKYPAAVKPEAMDQAIQDMQDTRADPQRSKVLAAMVQAAKRGEEGAIKALNRRYAATPAGVKAAESADVWNRTMEAMATAPF